MAFPFSGVATANHCFPVSSTLTPTTCMSSFTASINLLYINVKAKSPKYHDHLTRKEKPDLKLRRSSALSSLPSLCQVTLGEGTARNGTGMCNFSVSTTTRSRVWKSRAGLPGSKTHTHIAVGANLKFATSAVMRSQTEAHSRILWQRHSQRCQRAR